MDNIKNASHYIEDCELDCGSFSKVHLIQSIQEMTEKEYKNFCREILLLSHHYYSSIGTPACDSIEFVKEHQDKFFKHAKIDLVTETGFVAQEVEKEGDSPHRAIT